MKREYPSANFYEDFDLCVHVLYDDTTVLSDPAGALEDILQGQAEVDAMVELRSALDLVFDRHGTNRSDEEYISSSEWASVVEAARAALAVLLADE